MSLAATHSHSRSQNLFNLFLLLISPLPAFSIYYYFKTACPVPSDAQVSCGIPEIDFSQPFFNQFCSIGIHYPAFFLHILLFINFDFFLWILSLAQSSTWLIDPWWTLLGPCMFLYFSSHPLANFDVGRSILSFIALMVWSTRLTHSYFRREEYQFGAREDWRFTEMKKDYIPVIGEFGWKIASFFVVYLAQHVLLFGVTLPAYAIHFNTTPLSNWDLLIFLAALAGIKIAYVADTSLRSYMVKKLANPNSVPPVLSEGLWNYSQHPNYFGEIFFWSAFACWAGLLNEWSYFWGTGINTLCLIIVSFMVEKRMRGKPERIAAFEEYQRNTSRIIPWFKSNQYKKNS